MTCVLFQIFSITEGWSHGTQGDVIPSDGYLVTAEYDDGEPMNYAEIKIKSPDSDVPFQTGRTDLLGHFLFKPDRPGKWEIEVLDGMGHRLALEVLVDENNEENAISIKNDLENRDIKPFWKAVVGVSIIFGFFGLWYGWKAKQLINASQRNDIKKN
jgi:nickel transport protein